MAGGLQERFAKFLSHNDYWPLAPIAFRTYTQLGLPGQNLILEFYVLSCVNINNFRQLKLGTYTIFDMEEKRVGIQYETHPLTDLTLLSNPRQTTYSILGRKKNMLSSSILLIIYSTKLYTIHITIFKITIAYFTNLG